MDKVKDLDLYLLLGVDPDADETVIKKAYRKKALTCHPDKNPDNPKAAELFHQLSEAIAVLTDEKAKAAYDNLLKARKRREIEGRLLDSKRKKLKDDLEARERAAAYNQSNEEALAGARLKAEIERLQKEGKKQMEEEQERFRQTFEQEKNSRTSFQVPYGKPILQKWGKRSVRSYGTINGPNQQPHIETPSPQLVSITEAIRQSNICQAAVRQSSFRQPYVRQVAPIGINLQANPRQATPRQTMLLQTTPRQTAYNGEISDGKFLFWTFAGTALFLVSICFAFYYNAQSYDS